MIHATEKTICVNYGKTRMLDLSYCGSAETLEAFFLCGNENEPLRQKSSSYYTAILDSATPIFERMTITI